MRAPRLLSAALLSLGLATTTLTTAHAAPPDNTPPTVTVTGVSWQTFFPAVDRYRDTTRIDYTVADDVSTSVDVTVTVTDATDAVVDELVVNVEPGARTVTWNGTDSVGNTLPGGSYTVSLAATDGAGNASTPDSRAVTIDEGRLVTRTFRHSVLAKPTVVEKDVRRCGALKSPVRGWRRSLGYYANARCGATGTASVAATVNGMFVPRAFEDADRGAFYKKLTITTVGGNARQRPGAESYLQYWNYAQQKWFAGKAMGSRVGSHAGPTKAGKPMVVPSSDTKPYVIWSLLTANGHWYDVKKFQVVLKYQVMRRPAVDAARPVVPSGAPTGVSVPAPSLP